MDFEVKIFNDIWETEKKAPIIQLRKMNIKNISNRMDIACNGIGNCNLLSFRYYIYN